jgi:hypothetical protein
VVILQPELVILITAVCLTLFFEYFQHPILPAFGGVFLYGPDNWFACPKMF